MTQQLNSDKGKNRRAIVEDISALLKQQKQKIQRQEVEIQRLRTTVGDNRLAEAIAIRQLKNIYSKVYIEAKESRR